MVVILVPGLRAEDLLSRDSYLREIVSRSAIGWMNTRTARVPGQTRDSVEAACLTLGAGSRAAAGSWARQINPDSLARLVTVNSHLDHPVSVGLLGDMLHAAGRSTQVFGGIDTDVPSDSVKLVAMDRAGRLDEDQTDSSYWAAIRSQSEEDEDPLLSPCGLQTDMLKSAAHFARASFSVMCFGDIERADRQAPLCLPQLATEHRNAAVYRLSAFLFEPAVASVDSPSLFVLMAPCPADSAAEGDRLAPIMMWGDGVEPGLLTSGSTHTPGLVTNTDFLPTVARYFGITPPNGLVGRPMSVVPLPGRTRFQDGLDGLLGRPIVSVASTPNPERWAEMHDRWYLQSRKQSVFGGLPTIQFLIVLASLFLAARTRHVSLSLCLLVSMSALPLALLVLPPLSPASVVGSGVLLGAVLLLAAGFAWLRPGAAARIAAASLAGLIGVVVLDLVSGGALLRQAWMSYSVMEGARYYGIGNEYVGAVFGAMMALSLVMLSDRAGRWPWVAAAWLVVCGLIGLPQLGANAGGFMGAALGCGAGAMVWRQGGLRGRDVAVLAILAAAVMGGFLAIDILRGGADQSHIARALGGGSVPNIAWRKAMLNGWLLFHSPWTLGVLAASFGLWKLWTGRGRAIGANDRMLCGAWTGLVVGSVALFALNDSGVVAAAECLLVAYAGFSLFLPIMDSQPQISEDSAS